MNRSIASEHKVLTITDSSIDLVISKFLVPGNYLEGIHQDYYKIQQCKSILEAQQIFQKEAPECILLDWELQVLNREEYLQQINAEKTPIVILVSSASERLLPLFVQDYLVKETLTKELLFVTLRNAITQNKLKQKLIEAETKLQKYELAELLIESREHQDTEADLLELRLPQLIEDLRQSEAKSRETQEIAKLGSWELDIATGVVKWSPEIFHILGLNNERTELTYDQISQYFDPDDWKNLDLLIKRAIQYGLSYEMDLRFLRSNGTTGYMFAKGKPRFNKLGEPKELLGIVIDITERKEAEFEIQQNRRFIQQIADTSPSILYLYNVQEQRNIYSNREIYSTLGYTVQEIQAMGSNFFQKVMHPDDLAKLPDNLELMNASTDGEIIEIEYRMKHANGEWRWLYSRDTVFSRDACGRVLLKIGAAQDITRRKQVEEALQKSETHLRALFSAIPDWIVRVSLSGDYLEYLTSPTFDVIDSDPKMAAANAFNTLYPDLAQKRIEYIQMALATNTIQIYEQNLIINGRNQIEEVRVVPYCEEEVLVIVRDISDRKNAEIQLKQQAERQKLLAAISQNIRSSLNLEEILSTAVAEIHQVLKSDRVLVYHIFADGSGTIVAESLEPNCKSLLNIIYPEELFPKESQEKYLHGRVYTLCDLDNEPILPCLAESLQEIQVRAILVVPIIQNANLWGLLIAHQCDSPRQWQSYEIDLLQQLSYQLSIAIQQAELYRRLQLELSKRQYVEQIIRQQAEKEHLLREITQRIRQSLDLHSIFETATLEIRQFLNADRVCIFRFEPDTNCNYGEFIAESVAIGFDSIIAIKFHDDCFGEKYAESYRDGKFYAVADIHNNGHSKCHIDLLSVFQIRANLVVPLLKGNTLWGLLCIHQCSSPRLWKTEEINLIQQISNQLAIAIQQAKLYKQVQAELADKEKLYLQLSDELRQKKVLLKEVHHRVKNNLQVMSSLLRMQFRKTNPKLKSLIEDYQNRIQAMALIHAQLHQNDDLANINFHDYVSNLTTNLFQCYCINSELVQCKLEIDNISLSIDLSVPLGLIINELISNILKYAFPKGIGEITIQLTQTGNLSHLTVSDNGAGIKSGLDLKKTGSLGMQLVYSLTEQLEGEITYSSGNEGTKFQIIFPTL